MCNCGCDSTLITIPKGDTGATGPAGTPGATGPVGPQGPAGAAGNGAIIFPTQIVPNATIGGSGYNIDFLITGTGLLLAGDYASMGYVHVTSTGGTGQKIDIEYYLNGVLTSLGLLSGTSFDVSGNDAIIPVGLAYTFLVPGDVMRIKVKGNGTSALIKMAAIQYSKNA